MFFREFSNYLESVLLSKEQILLTDDLNIHVYDISISDTWRFADLLESFGLKQHVMQPTHEDGHTLVLIITRCSDCVLMVPAKVDQLISDYASVWCRLLPEKPPVEVKVIAFRKLINL